MDLKKELKEHSFTVFRKKVEAEMAKKWPERLLTISKGGIEPGAICLLSSEFTASERDVVSRAIAEGCGLHVHHFGEDQQNLRFSDGGEAQPIIVESEPQLLGRQQFDEDLALVVSDAVKSRMPYAVLLLSVAENPQVPTIISHLAGFDYGLYGYGRLSRLRMAASDTDTIAIILPTAGLKRARQWADEIRRALDSRYGSVNIGVGASSFASKLALNDFLSQVEECLEAACTCGNAVRWQAAASSDRSCQVTAEERRQLFSW